MCKTQPLVHSISLLPLQKMMFYLLILLISLCDIYPVFAPDDFLFKDFSVTSPLEDIGTGCVDNPFSGGPVDLNIPLADQMEPTDEPLPSQTNMTSDRSEKISMPQFQSAVVPIIPPEQHEPAFFPTPEPAAIIVISGLLLLALLFGRQRRAY